MSRAALLIGWTVTAEKNAALLDAVAFPSSITSTPCPAMSTMLELSSNAEWDTIAAICCFALAILWRTGLIFHGGVDDS